MLYERRKVASSNALSVVQKLTWILTAVIIVAVTITVKHSYCVPPLVDRGRIRKQTIMFLGVRIQTQTKMFSVFCEMSLSTAAASGLSAACSMHVVRQQRQLCRRFVDMSAVWRDEARSADRAGISATGVSKSEMYSGVCPRSDLWIRKYSYTLKLWRYFWWPICYKFTAQSRGQTI